MTDPQLPDGEDPGAIEALDTPIEQPIDHPATNLGNDQPAPVNAPVPESNNIADLDAALAPALVHHPPEDVLAPLLKSFQGHSTLTGETQDG